jgi:hypothetical protein
MNIVRPQFLHLAAASTAVFASPYVARAQEQAKIGVAPPRSGFAHSCSYACQPRRIR